MIDDEPQRSMSLTRRATVRARPSFVGWAAGFTESPSERAASVTRLRTSADPLFFPRTPPLRTRDAVVVDTPANRATSARVGGLTGDRAAMISRSMGLTLSSPLACLPRGLGDRKSVVE